jgi:hypothetical protein
VVKEQACVKVVSEVDKEFQSAFIDNKFIFLLVYFLVLSKPAFFTLTEFQKYILQGYGQDLPHDLLAAGKPAFVFIVTEAMAAAVLRNIELVFIALDDEWEFRQIVVVNAVTTDALPFGLFAYMPVNFFQSVPKH